VLTIWGRANSSNVMKVLWLCDALGLRHRRIDVGGAFGGTREPDFLRRNPNALVPVLEEEDGFTLWESNAVLRHLARTRPGGEHLYPHDPRTRARIDQWLDWQLSAVTRPTTTLFFTHVRLPEAQRDWPAHDAARDEAEALWRIADAALADRDYVCGAFSIADIALSIYLHRWFALPIRRPELPALRAWYERLRGHQGFRDHMDQPMT